MTLTILLLLFVVCYMLNEADEYNPAVDSNPDKLSHKLIRSINHWLLSGEKMKNN